MNPIKKLLVCLDLTDIDPVLIRYAAFIAPRFSVEKIFFLHVIQAYDLPDKTGKKFPDVENVLSRVIHKSMDEQVSAEFRETMETEILTGTEDQDAANGILHCIEDRDIDLVLIGQKSGEDRQGHYGKKIIKNYKCDTLLIPEDANLKIDRILCALDFSKDSEKAFSRGLYLQKKYGSTLVCYYIYDTTNAYFPASTEKSVNAAQKKAKQKYREFLDHFDMNPDKLACHIGTGDADNSESKNICKTAGTENADLIVVGAEGTTANVTTLLGHIAESLRLLQKQVPVMIVKNTKNASSAESVDR
jgi:nucleotide-binding universal stress UspA family protein